MLTPAFELKQDDYFLTVSIRAPFAKVGNLYYYLVKNYKYRIYPAIRRGFGPLE